MRGYVARCVTDPTEVYIEESDMGAASFLTSASNIGERYQVIDGIVEVCANCPNNTIL